MYSVLKISPEKRRYSIISSLYLWNIIRGIWESDLVHYSKHIVNQNVMIYQSISNITFVSEFTEWTDPHCGEISCVMKARPRFRMCMCENGVQLSSEECGKPFEIAVKCPFIPPEDPRCREWSTCLNVFSITIGYQPFISLSKVRSQKFCDQNFVEDL